jgi:hypothetical protein
MDTYATLADAYDTLTGHYPYERWLGAIEDLAREMFDAASSEDD